MANFFDQFDPAAAAPPPRPPGNFFDQFDPPAAAAQAAPAMPAPVGVDEYGGLLFDSATREGKAANHQSQTLPMKALEGMTFGMSPHLLAGAAALAGGSYGDTLKAARDASVETNREHPIAAPIAEGIGSLLPTLATFGMAAPAIRAAGTLAPRVGGPLARALVSGEIGVGSALGHDVGSGETTDAGPDMGRGFALGAGLSGAGDVAGKAIQAIPNMSAGLYQGVRNIATGAGREGVAGQILREVSGDFPNQAARSPLADLLLRAPQATGNPGLASLEDTLASDGALNAGPLGGRVINHVTPDQTRAVAGSLVGADAGIEPAVLANQASARGVGAITGAHDALKETERELWGDPALRATRLNAPNIAAGISQDIAGFPASWRDAITGPQNKLGAYLRELHELGPTASIADINSVRSRLLGAARDAASGPQPDSVVAAAANKMAGGIIDRMGSDPAITGSPATTKFFMTEPMPLTHIEVPDPVTIRATAPVDTQNVSGGDAGVPTPQRGGAPSPNQFAITTPVGVGKAPVPIHIRAASSAEVPPDTAAWDAYQRARDFTRQMHDATGYNEFDNILHPNAQGNMQGNAERQFGQFFDTTGGTSAGLQRLQGLADFARQSGHETAANELESSARDYLRAATLKQARAGNGIDATGQPNTNLATLASTANKLAPALNATPMTQSLAPDIQAAGNAAELLARPRASGGTNSATYERLRNNDLVSAIVGQSGSSALGAAAGGYGGYRAGDAVGLRAWASVPGGMLAGALGGRVAAPVLGRAVAGNPITRGLVTGPSHAIQQQLWEALSSLPAYERAMATPMLSGPRIGQPGAASLATQALARAMIEPTARSR